MIVYASAMGSVRARSTIARASAQQQPRTGG